MRRRHPAATCGRVRSCVVLLPGTRGLNTGARARGPLASRLTMRERGPDRGRRARHGQARVEIAQRHPGKFPIPPPPQRKHLSLHHLTPATAHYCCSRFSGPARQGGLSPLRCCVQLKDPSRAARRSKREVRARALCLLPCLALCLLVWVACSSFGVRARLVLQVGLVL
jgi:hypothetical protein